MLDNKRWKTLMDIKTDLNKRAKEDFSNWLLVTYKPEFNSVPPDQSPQITQPFDFHAAFDLENNMLTFIIVGVDLGEELRFIPQLILQTISEIRQGKSGSVGSFLLAGKDFSSKEMIFNNQVRIYTDQLSSRGDEIIKFIGQNGLRVLLKEYGDTVPIERRYALIIGVGNYQNVPTLKNPANDASAMEETLNKLDFITTSLIDPDLRTLKATIDKFASELAETDVALVYFVGHGIQSKE